MKNYFVDTNFFLRFLLDDVPEQASEVQNFLKQAKKEEIRLIVLTPIVFEMNYALYKEYRLPLEVVTRHLGAIVNMPFVEVENREIFQEAILVRLRTDLDFVDCFLSVKARAEGGEVLSFDNDFKKLQY